MTITEHDIRAFRLDVPTTATGRSHAAPYRPEMFVSAPDVTIRRWAERDHNVTRWTELECGGHFLSMEAPELLVDDVRAFFGTVG